MSTMLIILVTAVVAAGLSAVVTAVLGRLRGAREMSGKDALLAGKEAELRVSESLRSQSEEAYRESLAKERADHEKAVRELKDGQEESLRLVRESHENTVRQLKDGHEQAIRQLKDGHDKAIQQLKDGHEQAIQQLKDGHDKAVRQLNEDHEKAIRQLRENYEASQRELKENCEKTIGELKENHAKALGELKESQEKIIESTKTELRLENEKIIRQREEAIKKEAEESIRAITGDLNKDIREMRDKVDAQMKAQAEHSASIKTKFDETVTNLRQQTESIGHQAVDLANALKGKNKMQGIFGETILENILKAEGLQEGRDYESEFWLRDKDGNIIHNEDTGKRMRPDFALHFPDSTDILIDSKVSLTALAAWFEAQTEEQKAEASAQNLQSVLGHISELTSKEYQKYVRGRKTLDYVIMFIPNYGAYQLAKQEDPGIFKKAFDQNVLITTEETLIPFLRLIRSAWVQKETMDNIGDVMDAAHRMVDRVALFCSENAKLEKDLEDVVMKFKTNSARLTDSRQSIAKAAWDVVGCGAQLSAGKTLPELTHNNE